MTDPLVPPYVLGLVELREAVGGADDAGLATTNDADAVVPTESVTVTA